MDLGNYVKSMLPRFEKSTVRSDIVNIKNELDKYTIPAMEKAVANLDLFGERNQLLIAVNKNGKFQGHVLKVILDRCVTVRKGLDSADDLVEKYFDADIGSGAMSAPRAIILQYIEAASFLTSFTRKFMQAYYVAERIAASQFEDEVRQMESDNKRLMKEVSDRLLDYIQVLHIAATDTRTLEKHVEAAPDVKVDPDNLSIVQSISSRSKLDPLNFGLIPVRLNPIYHIRMAIANWQVQRHNLAKEELQLLEFRLFDLKKRQAGEPDPKIARQIEYYEGRVEKLRFKIHQVETDYE